MSFVSLTRLRLRSVLYLPAFALMTHQSISQVRRAQGFQIGALLSDRQWAFWTLTAWDTQESMRAYMLAGAHKTAMPKLMTWCDEASVAHWHQDDQTLPGWDAASQRMRAEGRISKVLHPSPQHQSLTFREPRTTRGGPIHPIIQ